MTRDDLVAAYRRGLAAVDPAECTRTALATVELQGPVHVAALGKAAPAMVRGAVTSLGARVASALAVGDHPEPVPPGTTLLLGDHPIPGEASLRAGRALLEFVAGIPPHHDLLVLVSGGGSALAEVPAEGLGIGDVARITRELMDAGTPIEELNVVRRHLSQIKNGGLLRAAGARRVLTLLVSDVVDGDASVIASGPTLADASTIAGAREVIEARLGTAAPELTEAPIEDHPEHHHLVIADGAAAAHRAAEAIEGTVWTTALRGEASSTARAMLEARGERPLVATGETTVTVRGGGLGGRNQEAALAAAIALDGGSGLFAALGTDGIDGPTDAAGGIVDGGSAARMRAAGIDPRASLVDNDAHTALEASGDLVVTGPSGTNVGDLWFAVR